jgi:hypothetical protein
MKKQRARLAAGATILALGGLGGVALGTNHGLPAATSQTATATGSGNGPIVTSTSGATATMVSQPTTAPNGPGHRPPIITRASGGAGPGSEADD